MIFFLSNAYDTERCVGYCYLVNPPDPHHLKAAPDTGLNVAASEGCHLSELPRDLHTVVQEKAESPLVWVAIGVGDQAEQDWKKSHRQLYNSAYTAEYAGKEGVYTMYLISYFNLGC